MSNTGYTAVERVGSPPEDRAILPSAKESDSRSERMGLWSLFWMFLKIGCMSFGGFMVLISVVEDNVVKRRALLQHKQMLDGISLANLLPGPMAVNVVAFVGYKLRGGMGALASTIAVSLPSFFLMIGLSYLYFKYGQTVGLQNIFRGFMPAIAAVILSVVWRMGKKTIKGMREAILAVVSAIAMAATPGEFKLYVPIGIIAGFALIGYYLFRNEVKVADAGTGSSAQGFSVRNLVIAAIFLGSLVALWFFPLPLENNSPLLLLLTFASMSLMLFGSGYVFIPVIGSIVVLQYGWVTQQEFTDGVALGQIMPGPILITATFIGFKVAGFLGALSATIGIFTPPAVLMVFASQALDFLQRSRAITAAMRAIHCGVIGMIFIAGVLILRSAFPAWPIEIGSAWPAMLILLGSLFGLIRFNLDAIWIIPTAGLLGYLLY